MKRLLLLAAALLATGTAATASDRNPDLKLMSFNVRYINKIDGDNCWDNRKEAVVEVGRRECPDVAGFQEPRGVQVGFICGELSDIYANVRLGGDYGDKRYPEGGSNMIVIWRKDKFLMLDHGYFWLSETPDRVSRGWDAMCRRIAVWVRLMDLKSGKQFFYLNTHFDHKGREARLREAEMVAEQVRLKAGESLPAFVSGDLNMKVDSPSLAPLREIMKTARENAPITDDKPSFNGFGKSRLHIDHILYRNARPLCYQTLDGDYGVPYVSDHYPIVCTFDFE